MSEVLHHASGGTTNRSDNYHQSYRDLMRPEGQQWIAKVVCGQDRWLIGPYCTECESDRAGFQWMRDHFSRPVDRRVVSVPSLTESDVFSFSDNIRKHATSIGEERLMVEILLRAVDDLESPFTRREAVRWFLDREPSAHPFAARNVLNHFGIDHDSAIRNLGVLRAARLPEDPIVRRRSRSKRGDRVA